jgi:hypothetical protein
LWILGNFAVPPIYLRLERTRGADRPLPKQGCYIPSLRGPASRCGCHADVGFHLDNSRTKIRIANQRVFFPGFSDVGNALPQQYLFLPSGHVDDLIDLPFTRETLENPSEPSEPARRSEHPAFQVPMRFMLGARSTPSAPAEPQPNAYRRPFRRLFMSRRHIFRRPLPTISLQTHHLGCAVSQCPRSAGHGRSRALTHSLGRLAGQTFFTANSALSNSTKNLTPLSALAADPAIICADEEDEPQSMSDMFDEYLHPKHHPR